tara:strand:+ start:880 stop:1356 length:477 start_codon:yes stop_codon:yes gene_type:complete
MPHQIIEDIKLLKTVCEPCSSIAEGKEIAEKLFLALSVSENGVGLAANQIGINKRVCVIKVGDPMYLVNPRIVGAYGKTTFVERCLSFPDQSVTTVRHNSILIEADNLQGPQQFGVEKGKIQKSLNNFENLLKCVCIQHEIDHLDGLTMFDRQKQQWE